MTGERGPMIGGPPDRPHGRPPVPLAFVRFPARVRRLLAIAAVLVIISGLAAAVGTFRSYQIDSDGDATAGWEYINGSDDSDVYKGFLVFPLALVVIVLGIVLLRWPRVGVAVASAIVSALALLVALTDRSAALHEIEIDGGGSLGRGIVLVLAASSLSLLVSGATAVLIACSVVHPRSPRASPPSSASHRVTRNTG